MAVGATLTPDNASAFSRSLGPHRKHSRHDPCPTCGGTDSFCISFTNNGMNICGRTPNDRPCGIGFAHWPNGRSVDWRDSIAVRRPPAPRLVVDADLADRAYRALLARCPLSDAHRASLRERGLSDEQIARHGYATAPSTQTDRQALVAEVAVELDEALVGRVPGFILDKKGRLDLVCGDGEMFIPVRDVRRRIVGIRRRMDDPGEGNKYKWLSRNGEGRIGIDGHTVHVAYPAVHRTEWVVIVEGEIKANIVADHFGCIAISVPGINNTGQVTATVAILGATDVAIAYDKDTKPITVALVVAAERKLAQLLAGARCRVAQWTWDTAEAKGIDDLLAAGGCPFPIPHPEFEAARTDAPIPVPAVDVKDELAQLQKLLSLSNAARRSPNLGAERHTLTDFATMLSAQPEGEWVPVPYSKLGDQAGVNGRTAERQLAKAGIHPAEGEAGILEGLIDVAVREVPERVNKQTGQVTGGYKAVHVRRRAPLDAILHRIATAPAPKTGRRNNHGGKRTPCPRCGGTSVERTTTDRCAGCGELIGQTVRIIDNEHDPMGVTLTPALLRQDVAAATPSRQDDAHPLRHEHDESDVPGIDASRIPSYRGDNLPSTPPAPAADWESTGELERSDRENARRREAHASLAAWQDRPEVFVDGNWLDEDGSEPAPSPTLFPLPLPGCLGCGGAVSDAQPYCRACDPTTA